MYSASSLYYIVSDVIESKKEEVKICISILVIASAYVILNIFTYFIALLIQSVC